MIPIFLLIFLLATVIVLWFAYSAKDAILLETKNTNYNKLLKLRFAFITIKEIDSMIIIGFAVNIVSSICSWGIIALIVWGLIIFILCNYFVYKIDYSINNCKSNAN